MTDCPGSAYLRDAVMTASPEQLQLMLYDGAIRFASQGQEAIKAENHEEAFEKLSRAQKIVLEMEQALNHDLAPDLCERMSSLYLFVYRKLVDGCVERDLHAIEEALGILRFERETWVMLMEKLAKEATKTSPQEAAESASGGSLSVEG